jgi:hypothetical protein
MTEAVRYEPGRSIKGQTGFCNSAGEILTPVNLELRMRSR